MRRDTSQCIGLSSDESNSFVQLLDSFPTTMKKNINKVISKVDGASHLSSKSGLQKRWESISRIEQEHFCRISSTSNEVQPRGTKSSIVRWDDALRRNGYCMICKSKEAPEFEEKAALSSSIDYSPIFGFELNGQQYSTNFEAKSSSIERKKQHNDFTDQHEVQRIINTNKNVREKWDKAGIYDAIIKSISLLIAMRPEDWRKYDLNAQFLERNNLTNHESTLNQIDDYKTITHKFLLHVVKHKYVITTLLLNLLLAHLATSTEIEHQEIGDACLQIFGEIKTLSESGQCDCKPDSMTYRILILAFRRRFQGLDEAIRLSHELAESSSIHINPDLLNEALRACRAKSELTVARLLINSALSSNHNRLDVSSCILHTEVLKDKNLDREAIEFFSRIKKANILSRADEDEYLKSLCRWPKRNRRGDILDLSSFWTNILAVFEQNMLSSKIPEIKVWITFLEGLHSSAKNDTSLWKLTARAARLVLDSYSQFCVGRKLMTIGLDASFYMQDPKLASLILERVAKEPNRPYNSSDSIGYHPQIRKCETKVPFRLLKKSLETCLRTSDINSAQSILRSLDKIGDSYPLGAKADLHSLVVSSRTRGNDAENSK